VNPVLGGPENVRLTHRLLGTEPNAKQRRIYDAYPGTRGLSDRGLDEETFESVLVMALTQTLPRANSEPFKCYFFVPASVEKWAIEQLNVRAKRIFAHLKPLKGERKVLAARQLGSFFHCILMGSRVLQLEQGPERWVAFGFDKTDPIPEWLREGLLDKLVG
jgi:hypothetical protein